MSFEQAGPACRIYYRNSTDNGGNWSEAKLKILHLFWPGEWVKGSTILEEVNQSYYSNLRQVNETDWTYFYNPPSNFSEGNYSYYACADDWLGNNYCTSEEYVRYISFDEIEWFRKK